jgi:hypothetical protein
MNPSHHIHIGLAFRAALIASALLLAAKSAGLAAEGLGAFDPDQAIVFDGSTAARDIFTLALKNDGYFVELTPVGFVCPETEHVSPGGLFALIGEAGVFTLELEIGETLLLPVPPAAGELPDALADLETDCDLLEALPALEAYLVSAGAQAQARLLETQACRDRVRILYCQLVASVEEAETVLGAGGTHAAGGGGGTGKVEFSQPEECPGVTHLAEIPGVLDYLESLVGSCDGVETALASLQAHVNDTVQSAGGLTQDEKQNFLAGADAGLGDAERNLLDAADTVAGLGSLTGSLSEESLEASCAECEDPIFTGSPLALSGAVTLFAGRQVVGRFVGAFHSAANDTDDPQLAARLADLAGRLAAVPNDRVLQVLFPSGSGVGQHLLALRAPELPDDGESPLVVVLTGWASEAPGPAPNAADIQLLFEHVRLFGDTLARESGRLAAP